MRIRNWMIGGLTGLAVGLGAPPAQAEKLVFHAELDGRYGAATGSEATGKARIRVDTQRRRVSVDLTLDGIAARDLWQKLVAAPIGPIHFHKYATAAGGDSVLVLPLPYGPQYRATELGLRVTFKDHDYAAAAGLANSKLTFDEFVAAMRGGLVVLNVHTNKVNPGEISGLVTEDR